MGTRRLPHGSTNLPASGGGGRKSWAPQRGDWLSMSGMLNVLAIARPTCPPGKDPALDTPIPLTRMSQATGKGQHDYYY
jgi:hypothetical protein